MKAILRIVLVSNFLNHHQLSLCQGFLNIPNVQFHFIALKATPSWIISVGYQDMNSLSFVIRDYENPESSLECLNTADVVIFDGFYKCDWISEAAKRGKLVFVESERLFKGKNIIKNVVRKLKYKKLLNKSDAFLPNVYLLTMSSYARKDFARCGFPENRVLRWGYFTSLPVLGEEQIEKKFVSKTPFKIIWVGRMLKWKRPMIALDIFSEIESRGYDARLSFYGDGPLRNKIEKEAKRRGLSNKVAFYGFEKNDAIISALLNSHLGLATSDTREGWGAVINEIMGAGCAIMASALMGAAPVLIEDGRTGFLFKKSKAPFFKNWISRDDFLRVALAGRKHIESHWNGQLAALNLTAQIESIREGRGLLKTIEGHEPASIDGPAH